MIHLHLTLCVLITICGIIVVSAKNPIESIVSLILCFCNAGILLFCFKADFLGLIYVIVYVGAVAVLFLFVIMMIDDKKILNYNKSIAIDLSTAYGFKSAQEYIDTLIYNYWPRTTREWDRFIIKVQLVFFIIFLTIFSRYFFHYYYIIYNKFRDLIDSISIDTNKTVETLFENTQIDSLNNIDILGQILFNYYYICFLIAGLVLLVALIGAIVLTTNLHTSNKKQISNRQLARLDNFLTFFKKQII